MTVADLAQALVCSRCVGDRLREIPAAGGERNPRLEVFLDLEEDAKLCLN
jgi:hypothetical protein